MDLEYEIINDGTGYMIKKDGVNWIKQDSYIPYSGETIEESAQNHIDAILAEQQADEPSEVDQLHQKVGQLESDNADLWYENFMTKNELETANNEIAELWYFILTNGGNE